MGQVVPSCFIMLVTSAMLIVSSRAHRRYWSLSLAMYVKAMLAVSLVLSFSAPAAMNLFVFLVFSPYRLDFSLSKFAVV